MRRLLILFLPLTFLSVQSLAKAVKYNLVVEQKAVNMSGHKSVDFALTVNGGIPAPTLEFTEGDDAEITVTNKIPTGEDVSIHWHGILLPPLEDGVPFVNTPPIYKDQSRTFKFPIRQNGTYWYHSHTMLQEQKGVFGSIVIHPKKETIKADKDVVVVLSDWSDENADQILRNLKKDGDFYQYKKGTIRSYFDAAKNGKLMNQFKNEWTRMGGMDLSDIGYDAFLINGKKDSQLTMAHAGEVVRVRIINAAASTYFKLSLGGLPMKVVSADGTDIKPVRANEIFMGMAETYDVLFTVPENKNYELRATAQDGTGFASAFIGMNEKVLAKEVPKPDLYALMMHSMGGANDTMMGMDMDGMTSSGMQGMDHSQMKPEEKDSSSEHASMKMPKKTRSAKASSEIDHSKMKMGNDEMSGMEGMDHSTMKSMESAKQNETALEESVIQTLTVDNLKALKPTALPKNAKIHDFKLVLDGDMRRYVWHINGKTISEDRIITVNPGEIVRFTYQNDSMMYHPMHLHGHFFRVINKNGDYSPMKHTVDVPPMTSRTIEFYTDEVGQWMLHCHNLYHMDTGMARVVKYSNFTPVEEIRKHESLDHHLEDPWYPRSRVELSSNHMQGNLRLQQSWNEVDLRFESANIKGKNFSYNFKDEWDYEGDLLYRRWLGNWTSLIVGGTSYGEKLRGLVGIGHFLPMMIETDLLIDSEGKIRLDLQRRFQWTKTVFTELEMTWRPGNQNGAHELEVEASLMYSPKWSWGVGLMLTNDSIGGGFEYQF
ncbi:MAG: hypothetical protein B7Y39_08580 [Bdellovibrio sp. 28-41-41]|nr:MAG: hypothetical protein B7Y39_08580 [Bdellovibrio sp. 28-41-41]